jgi:hypothetical protein
MHEPSGQATTRLGYIVIEVCYCEQLNIYEALSRARAADAVGGNIPAVLWRPKIDNPDDPWVFLCYLADLRRVGHILETLPPESDMPGLPLRPIPVVRKADSGE